MPPPKCKIIKDVRTTVVTVEGNALWLRSAGFDDNIRLLPRQLRAAGFQTDRLSSGNQAVVDVRVEAGSGDLNVSQIKSFNGRPARQGPAPVR